MRTFYCIQCGRKVWTWKSGRKTFHFSFSKLKPVFGHMLTRSAPPELPEHWERYQTEPPAWELKRMDANARELVKSLMEQGINL